MTERRRLFIETHRFNNEFYSNGELILTSDESHYLYRVMRMRLDDIIEIVDGKGHLWNAKLVAKKRIKLTNNFSTNLQETIKEKPLICIAIAIPKKGFENFLQMSCEIGVDVIQPLITSRSVVKEFNEAKNNRFQKIIREAVEQSERLWIPELKKTLKFSNWIENLPSASRLGLATTRLEESSDLFDWLKASANNINEVWVVIGPEGGWNKDEEELAFSSGCVGVSLGKTILRTSTAAVSACQLIAAWRRLNL